MSAPYSYGLPPGQSENQQPACLLLRKAPVLGRLEVCGRAHRL